MTLVAEQSIAEPGSSPARALPEGFTSRSHPEWRAEQTEELISHAREIRAWQDEQAPRLSDERLVRRFRDLGSTRTYSRLIEGDVSSLKVEKHLPAYRKVVAAVRALAGLSDEPIYEDLTPALETGAAVAGVAPRHDKERLVVIEGPTGSGKTESLKLIVRKYEGNVALVEANATWRRMRVALADILRGLGGESGEGAGGKQIADLLREIIDVLRQQRMILAIDEGHHLNADCLNLVKTILNRTDSIVVVAAIDTIWQKLTAKNWEEAKQLLQNRMYTRVRLDPPTPQDAELFLKRRVGFEPGGKWKSALPKVCELARHYGYFAFLRRVAEGLVELAARPGPADLLEVAQAEAGKIKTHNKR